MFLTIMLCLNAGVMIFALVGLTLLLLGNEGGAYLTFWACVAGAIVKTIETGFNGVVLLGFAVLAFVLYSRLPNRRK